MDRVNYEPMLIQDIVSSHDRGELDLNPWYQRRACWSEPQKAYLINTIFEGKPVPSLYIRHDLDVEKEKSVRQVVDGHQRIRAILDYVAGQFPARHAAHRKPVRYVELSPGQRAAFRMTALSVGTLIGATESDVIEIFGRLNSVAKTLNPQEKRNAQFSGEFKQFCLKEAADRLAIWRNLGIFTANGIARMEEVQFVSEVVICLLEGLVDYKARHIDEVYRLYDADFPQREEIHDRMERVFSGIAALEPKAIRDTIFSRPPLLFTLLLVLDSHGKRLPPTQRVEDALYEIDARFKSDVPSAQRRKDDSEFFLACTSNMHRIKSRRVRDSYVRKFI